MRELDLSIQQVLERRHRNGEDKLPPGETAEKKITVETRQSVGSRIQRTRQVKTLLVDINVGYSPAKKLTTKSMKPGKKRNEAIEIIMDLTSRQTDDWTHSWPNQ